MSAARLLTLPAEPREADVLRLLGYKPGTTRLGAPILAVLREARDEALSLLRPRVALAYAERPGDFGAPGLFDGASKLALGAATIGPALERRAEELVERREWTKALVIDAYGSAAAEALAVAANALVCEESSVAGLVAGRRVSPGYPRWPVEQQRALFDRIQAPELGIELTEASVMTPRKSITFGIPLGTHLVAESPELGCRYCAMVDCAFRRQPAIALADEVA